MSNLAFMKPNISTGFGEGTGGLAELFGGADGQIDTATDAGFIQGKAATINLTNAANNYAVNWSIPPDAALVEVLGKIRMISDTGSDVVLGRVFLRGAATGTWYSAGLSRTAGGVKQLAISYKAVGSDSASLATSAFGWVANTWYWVRFFASGSSLKMKVWEDGAAEPTSWTVTHTDASLSAPGKIGATCRSASAANDLQLDYIAYGRGEHEAFYPR